MTRALVTGGAGFIGASVATALVERGVEVDIVDLISPRDFDATMRSLEASGRARIHDIDLMEPAALDAIAGEFDYIYHLAAILGTQNVLEQPYRTLRENMVLLDNVISFARRQAKLARLIFTSTSEVYAGSVLHLNPPFPTPENIPLALPPLQTPRTSYMLSKLFGEAMLIHAGVPYTIVRPHNIYGPRMGMSHVVPQLLQKAHRAPENGSLGVLSPSHTRTFCYVDDAVEMLVRLIQCEAAANKTINLGSEGPEHTMREVGEIVASVVGKNLDVVEGAMTPGSPVRRVPDMTLMTELTGYRAKVPLTEGVHRTYAWYRQHVFH